MRVWRHEFQVRGPAAFPVDMLRYDCCFPLHETESHEIERSIRFEAAAITVTLVHYDGSAKWEPTAGRWRSFGYEVLPARTRERREW